jgi:hypothetical protein
MAIISIPDTYFVKAEHNNDDKNGVIYFYLHLQDVGNRVTLRTHLMTIMSQFSPMMNSDLGHPFWTHNMDPQCGPPIWTPNMDPQYGPRFWTPILDSQYGPPM